MRRFLLASVSLLVCSAASANEPVNLNMMPILQTPGTWVIGGDASFEWVRLAPHENVLVQIDFGSGYVAPALQADAEGWNFSAGVARDVASGWRFGAHGSTIDADGRARGQFQLTNGTPIAIGGLDGALQVATFFSGSTVTIDQALDVDLSGFSLGLSAGQTIYESAKGNARADVSLTYRDLDTDFLNVWTVPVVPTTFITTATSFETRSVELVGHVSGSIPLGGRFTLGGGASAGFAFKDFDMDAATSLNNGAPVFASALHAETDHTGVVARVEANIGYDITDTVAVSAGGGFAFDSATASFVAPNFTAGTPARIDTKSATSPYAGVRVSARF